VHAAEQFQPPSKTGVERLRQRCSQPLVHSALAQVESRPASAAPGMPACLIFELLEVIGWSESVIRSFPLQGRPFAMFEAAIH
jgi:hypothetical protein